MSAFARVYGREIGAIGLRLAAYISALALVAGLAMRLLPVAESPRPAPPEAGAQWWVEVERPHAAFSVTVPDVPEANSTYRIMRDPAGGGRKDIIALVGSGRSALIEIYRHGRDGGTVKAPEIEIARRAAAIGAVQQVEAAPAVSTRFGDMALVDFTLIEGERRRGCLGFMRLVPELELQISGWVCHAGPGMVARTAVICALDKLTLLSAGGDANLAQFFAQAELKNSLCLQKRARPLAGRPADWIDQRQAIRLRGTAR